MGARWQRTRETFRHGNLPEALVDAALERLEAGGATSLSLRELARDAGVNHRAVYRHFPDKLALLRRVAEVGWKRMARRMKKESAGRKPGEDTLVAAGVGFFLFAREYPNLFHLMAAPRINTEGAYPALDEAILDALSLFMRGIIDTGAAPKTARVRAVVFAAALQGVTTQILHGRLRVSPRKAAGFVAETCRMLVKGLR